MASVKIILNVNPSGNGEINTWESSFETNNGSLEVYTSSIADLYELFDDTCANFGGAKTYPIGFGTIGSKPIETMETSDGNVQTDYKGISFLATEDADNPVADSELLFTIEGVDVINLKITFDAYTMQIPQTITVYLDDEEFETYTNESNIIVVDDLPTGEHEVKISMTDWALERVPIAITMIEFPEISLTLTKTSVRELASQSQMTSDNAHINYGVLASTGSMEIQDVDGKIYNKAMLGYFDANKFSAEVYLNNNLVQTHYSTDTPYYDADSTMQINFTNKLSTWADVVVPETTYSSATTLYQILCDILSYDSDDYTTDDINSMLSRPMLVGNTSDTYEAMTVQEYLEAITIPAFTLNEDSLLNQINKVCTVAQLQVCLNDVGNIKFFNARPVACKEELEEVILVPFEKQRSKATYNLLKDNKYNKVNFN